VKGFFTNILRAQRKHENTKLNIPTCNTYNVFYFGKSPNIFLYYNERAPPRLDDEKGGS
jgi:hypothetical protein